jgi:hypothetical protein
VKIDPKTSVAGAPAEPELPVLRFSLKLLFWWVTGVCVLLTVLVALPRGMSIVAVLLAIGVVTLHVLSTAIGTRLRDHANERRVWEAGQAGIDRPAIGSVAAMTEEPRRRSPMFGHDQPLRRMRMWLTAGAIFGGLLGVSVLGVTIGDRTTAAGIVVGGASTAVVGAWIAFVAASAWSIFRQGWRDAVSEHGRDEARGTERS